MCMSCRLHNLSGRSPPSTSFEYYFTSPDWWWSGRHIKSLTNRTGPHIVRSKYIWLNVLTPTLVIYCCNMQGSHVVMVSKLNKADSCGCCLLMMSCQVPMRRTNHYMRNPGDYCADWPGFACLNLYCLGNNLTWFGQNNVPISPCLYKYHVAAHYSKVLLCPGPIVSVSWLAKRLSRRSDYISTSRYRTWQGNDYSESM